MKKLFFLTAALVAACTMNAQTILIDGDNADWAEVPMLSDPGTMPVYKATPKSLYTKELRLMALSDRHVKKYA